MLRTRLRCGTRSPLGVAETRAVRLWLTLLKQPATSMSTKCAARTRVGYCVPHHPRNRPSLAASPRCEVQPWRFVWPNTGYQRYATCSYLANMGESGQVAVPIRSAPARVALLGAPLPPPAKSGLAWQFGRCVGGAEERSQDGRARQRTSCLTRPGCPSAAPAGRVASSGPGHPDEHRRVGWACPSPPSSQRPNCQASPDFATTTRPSMSPSLAARPCCDTATTGGPKPKLSG